MVIEKVKQRKKKQGWRKKAMTLWTKIFGEAAPPQFPESTPPWIEKWDPIFELEGGKGPCAKNNKNEAMANLAANWTEFDLTIYKDGSTSNGNKNAGAGILFTKEPSKKVEVIHTVSIPLVGGARLFKQRSKLLRLRWKK